MESEVLNLMRSAFRILLINLTLLFLLAGYGFSAGLDTVKSVYENITNVASEVTDKLGIKSETPEAMKKIADESLLFFYWSPYNLGTSINILQKDEYDINGERPYFYLIHSEIMKLAVVYPKLKIGLGVTYTNQFLRFDEFVTPAGAILPVYFYYILSYKLVKQPIFNYIFLDSQSQGYENKILPIYLYFGLCNWQDELGPGGMKDIGASWTIMPLFNNSINLCLKFGYMYCDYFYKNTLYITSSVEFGGWNVIKK